MNAVAEYNFKMQNVLQYIIVCKFHIQEEKLLTAARRDESSKTMAWRSVIALLTVVSLLEVAFHAEGKILLLRMRDSLAPRVAPSVQRSGLLHGVRGARQFSLQRCHLPPCVCVSLITITPCAITSLAKKINRCMLLMKECHTSH